MIYGQPLGADPGMSKPDPPRALLVDATSLEVAWDYVLDDVLRSSWCIEDCTAPHERRLFAYWMPAVIAQHDGRRLFIVHADTERLTTVDTEARFARTEDIRRELSWINRLFEFLIPVAHAKGGSRCDGKATIGDSGLVGLAQQ